MQRAINHMTVPGLGLGALLDLSSALGCVGVELRNDLDRPLADGMPLPEAAAMAAARGQRVLGLSQVYPFNDWSDQRAAQVAELVAMAKQLGAETISLIPRNDGTGTGNGERHANLRIAMKEIRPILAEAGLIALIEPLGFARSSLRDKTELVQTIEALDAADSFKLVHDTFHHALAGGGPIFAEHTGLVHLSGVPASAQPLGSCTDADRGLIDETDRLGNIDQITALMKAGYQGPFSFECFSPETHALTDPAGAIGASFDFISSQLEAQAA